MRSLDPNSNICRQNTSCHSGQASCHDSVKLRLSEGCEKWSDQQRCLSLENNYSVARLKLKAKDLCKMKLAFISGAEISNLTCPTKMFPAAERDSAAEVPIVICISQAILDMISGITPK